MTYNSWSLCYIPNFTWKLSLLNEIFFIIHSCNNSYLTLLIFTGNLHKDLHNYTRVSKFVRLSTKLLHFNAMFTTTFVTAYSYYEFIHRNYEMTAKNLRVVNVVVFLYQNIIFKTMIPVNVKRMLCIYYIIYWK